MLELPRERRREFGPKREPVRMLELPRERRREFGPKREPHASPTPTAAHAFRLIAAHRFRSRAGRNGREPPGVSAMQRSAVISAGILLGSGLGGFVDGILFHQILQWHNMLSSARPPIDLVEMKYNMFWDGLFHAFAWTMVTLGVWRLWAAGNRRDVPWSTRTFLGRSSWGGASST
jgi:hypothetical protein